MPAVPLRIATTAPEVFRAFAPHIDLQLGDVHSMLRLPLPARPGFEAIGEACNFSIMGTLLTIAAGVSTVVYPSKRNDSGQRFKLIFEEFYPWREERAVGGIGKNEGPAILYEGFRNSHVHALGIAITDDGGLSRMDTKGPDLGVARFAGQGLTEHQLNQVEQATSHPFFHLPTLRPQPDGVGVVLEVECLYWGVRRMIELVSANKERMKVAAWFLRGSEDRPAGPPVRRKGGVAKGPKTAVRPAISAAGGGRG